MKESLLLQQKERKELENRIGELSTIGKSSALSQLMQECLVQKLYFLLNENCALVDSLRKLHFELSLRIGTHKSLNHVAVGRSHLSLSSDECAGTSCRKENKTTLEDKQVEDLMREFDIRCTDCIEVREDADR